MIQQTSRRTPHSTRRLGAGLLLVTLLLSAVFLPNFYPGHAFSAESARQQRIMHRLAMAHLLVGAFSGFGFALLVWPFRQDSDKRA